jgi:hypothetical protein
MTGRGVYIRVALATVATTALLLTFWWPSSSARRRVPSDAEMTAKIGGQSVVHCIRNAKTATVQRVRQVRHFVTGHEDPRTLYERDGAAQELAEDDVKRLASLLTTPKSYDIYDPTVRGLRACIPYYGVYVSFISGNEQCDVWLTLFCTDAMFALGDRYKGSADFSPGEAEVMKVIQHLFPDDQEIQEWKP